MSDACAHPPMDCGSRFDRIDDKLEHIDAALRGNPEHNQPGMFTRLDRLEQTARRQARLMWIVLTASASALAAHAAGMMAG